MQQIEEGTGLDLSKLFNEKQDAVEGEFLPANTIGSFDIVKQSFSEFTGIVERKIMEAQEIAIIDEDSQKFAVSLVGGAKKAIKSIDERKKSLPQYKDAKNFIDSLNSFCRGLSEKFEKIVQVADPKVKQYTAQIELERRKAEEAARRAAQELQDRINRETEEANRKIREEAQRKADAELAARRAVEAEERAKLEAESKAQAEARFKREVEEMAEARRKAAEEAKLHEIVAPTVIDPAMPKDDNRVRTESGTLAFTKQPWIFEIINPDEVERENCVPSPQIIREKVKAGVRIMKGVRIYQDMQMNYR